MANLTNYDEDFIAHALAVLRSNKNNAKRTAVQLGIPRTTLRQWAGLSPVKGKRVSQDKVSEASEKLADRLDRIAARLSERIEEAVGQVPIETSADLKNMLIGQGITIEKASFARGGPTSRTESLKVSLIDPESLRGSALKVIEGGRKADRPAV